MNCSAALWSRLALTNCVAVITPRLTERALDAQVDRLLDELPSRFMLAGLSLGGIVAMALARTAPRRVASLILLSTNPYAPTPEQRGGWRASRAALNTGRTARELQAGWLSLLLSEPARDRPQLVETTLQMADDVGEADLDAQLALQETRVDERAGLAQLRCPLLLVAAADDALCTVARHAEMSQLVPTAKLMIVQNCGHLSPLERPDAVDAQLGRWCFSASAGF
ncbi:MAG TPA: alpha/beta hydrolase [Propionibacteriaceae bacterium]|nr:alpha/beta hydrolase [Propionibacteriaceae bacterium]